VKAWLGDSGWLTAPSLLTRISIAQQLTREYGDDGGFGFDLQKYATKEAIALLLDGTADPTLTRELSDLSPREAISLILASPLYQLA
jgi:hypothetical protein